MVIFFLAKGTKAVETSVYQQYEGCLELFISVDRFDPHNLLIHNIISALKIRRF